MDNRLLYNENGRECLYFRKFNNKDYEWWSFHTLSKQDIIEEIYFYISCNKSNPIFIRCDNIYFLKGQLFRKSKNTILNMLVNNCDFDNFKFIYISFRGWSVVLYKKGFEY